MSEIIIDATYRVITEDAEKPPERQPFFGPGATPQNILLALMSGCSLFGVRPEFANEPKKVQSWIAYLVIITIIAVALNSR